MGHRRKLCKRHDEPGDAHYLTFSCHRRLPLLRSPTACRVLAESIERARQKHGFWLWGYVFMPEHAHLLLMPTSPASRVSKILMDIKRPVAMQAISRLRDRRSAVLERLRVPGRGGSQYRFWQAGGGYDRNINSTQAVRETLDYMHHNPVRRGLVDRADEWEWSSARAWAGLPGQPLVIDRNMPVVSA